MDGFFAGAISLYRKAHIEKRWLRDILTALSAVVVFVTTYILILPAITIDTSDPSLQHLSLAASWNDSAGKLENIAVSFQAALKHKNGRATLQSSTDNGLHWTDVTSLVKTINTVSVGSNDTFRPSGLDSWINTNASSSDLDTRFRIMQKRTDQTTAYYSWSFDYYDLFEAAKPGFAAWIDGYYIPFGGGSAPTDADDLYTAFSVYYNAVSAGITTRAEVDNTLTAEVSVSASGSYVYHWQYRDGASWVDMDEDENGVSNRGDSSIATMDYPALKSGGADVRCVIYDSTDTSIVTATDAVFINAQQALYDNAINAINTGLGLANYTEFGQTFDITVGGTLFNDCFYYTEVAADPRVPFSDAASYQEYLVQTYLDACDAAIAGGESASDAADIALDAVRVIWNRYLYDLFDPDYKTATHVYYGYPDADTFGDEQLAWPKMNQDSFHHTNAAATVDQIRDDPGTVVDYDQFVIDMEKYATAAAAGDLNTQRKYTVNLNGNATPKLDPPVVLILQIQTSWQMFDLEHANALTSSSGATEKGACAEITDMATLYDIKRALLRFVDWMETFSDGRNLVLGVTDVQHATAKSTRVTPSSIGYMLKVPDGSGGYKYVSNNYDVLREALYGWDIFGNCEHVHYTTTQLERVCNSLMDNLTGWTYCGGDTYVPYDDVQKAVVIIGGTTENSNSTNGLGCVLPWSTFSSSSVGINSVYALKTVEGTPLSSNVMSPKIISWLDLSNNNSGDPYDYKAGDSTRTGGTNFTKKYITTNEDAIFNTLCSIARNELHKSTGGMSVLDESVFVEDVTVSDTITDEFLLDRSESVTAVVYDSEDEATRNIVRTITIDLQSETVMVNDYDSDGTPGTPYPVTAAKTGTASNYTLTFPISFDQSYNEGSTEYASGTDHVICDNFLHIRQNGDGTTDVLYDFGRIYNKQTFHLDFGVAAQSDFLGSNNVYTNDGLPRVDWSYKDIYDTTYYAGFDGSDTPQVNVPIGFDTVDGDGTTILIGDTENLKDLDASSIVAELHDLIDNYDQTNGTVRYYWETPDHTPVEELGTASVVNGVISGIPDLTYNFSPTVEGETVFRLVAVFTPGDVDATNPNFHDDATTKAACGAATEGGNVVVRAVDGSKKTTFFVRKDWPVSVSASEVQYYLLINGEREKDSGGDDVVYTLNAANEWKHKHEDLPAVDIRYSDPILNYTVEEIPVPGCMVSYGSDTEIGDAYKARITISSYTLPAQLASNRYLVIGYTWNGTPGTYIYKNTSGSARAKGTNLTNIIINDLPANGSGVYPYTIDSVAFTYAEAAPTLTVPSGETSLNYQFPLALSSGKKLRFTYQKVSDGTTGTVTYSNTSSRSAGYSRDITGFPSEEVRIIKVEQLSSGSSLEATWMTRLTGSDYSAAASSYVSGTTDYEVKTMSNSPSFDLPSTGGFEPWLIGLAILSGISAAAGTLVFCVKNRKRNQN